MKPLPPPRAAAPRATRPATLASVLALGLLALQPSHAAPAPALVQAPYVPDSGAITVHCGRLIDGVSGEARLDQTVTIVNGRIDSVRAGNEHDPALAHLELNRYTCLPGLIDMHTHLTEEPEVEADLKVLFTRTDAKVAEIAGANAQATLRAGFTTVRDLGTYIAWSDRTLRDSINRGATLGPRMQVVGFYLTIPGGGGDLVVPGVAEQDIPARCRRGVTRGPENFAAKAHEAIDGGADLIKVIASGAVLAYGGVPGEPEMTREEIAAAADVAHAAHRRLAAHAHGARSIKDAILAGATTIEHASYLDDEGIALAKAHDVALSMDVYNGDYTDSEGRRQHWPEEFLRKNLESTEAQRQAFTRAHAAGAAIVFGTDAGVYPHGMNARQFPIMVQRGMTPMQAIQSATSVAAHYMGWDDRVGRLAPGLYGDLIAVRADPLADIASLEHVGVVIKGGLVVRLPGER